MTTKTTRTLGATRRAELRGVDTMNIMPRPLRTPQRMNSARAQAQLKRAGKMVDKSITKAMKSATAAR